MGLAPEPGVGRAAEAATQSTSLNVKIGDHVYEWDGEYTFREGVLIEKITGLSFLDWLEHMQNPESRQMTNIGVLLFVVARREDPSLEWETFDFPLNGWSIESDAVDVDPTPAGLSPSDDPNT